MLVKRLILTAKLLTAIIVIVVLVVVVAGRERALTTVFGPIEIKPVNFTSLELTPKPNQFLVCPVGFCSAKPHMESPSYEISAEALKQRWVDVLKTQSKIEQGASDELTMQYDYVQRTPLMHFPDSITVNFIALNDNKSTLAIYSRSHYGKSDLGANEKRIRAWLAALGEIK